MEDVNRIKLCWLVCLGVDLRELIVCENKSYLLSKEV